MSDTQARIPPSRPHFALRDLFCAWLVATAFSGLPSTAYALLIGADPLEATLAAGGMLLPMSAPPVQLFMAAAVVHCSVSAFWTAVFGALLPRHPVVVWALAGSAVVAVLDLQPVPHCVHVACVGRIGGDGVLVVEEARVVVAHQRHRRPPA
jgi:hypothetical protein